MNQILYIQKSKKGSSLEVDNVVKISVIIILIFGIIAIAKGTFGMISSSNSSKTIEPTVSISEVTDGLQISISHNVAIDKIIYSWNDSSETTLQGKGQSNITEIIELPVGTNILHLQIVDINKKTTIYTKQYYKSDKDTISPEIEFVVENSKVKMVVKDDTQLAYIMYHWNDEDDTVVEPREDSKTQIEEKITILKGENTLTILAVDAAGNEATKEQKFKGAKKPTIEITQENNEAVVKITDEENIQKIEVTLNGQFYSTDSEGTGTALNMQEVEIRQPLQSGENTIVITAYSTNGLSDKLSKTITI